MPGPLGMLAAGTAAGIFTGAIENQRQLNQQKKMNEMSQRQHGIYNEMNRQSQLQLWKDTNYKAQIEQMELAGVNPALLYGGKGAGGITAAAATGGEAQPTATKGNDIITGMGMGLQSGMMQAQIDLIKSQAELAKTQAKKLGGVDTENAALEGILLKYAGKEAVDQYKIKSENRDIEADMYQKEMEARIGTAGTIYELWVDGKLKEKSLNEIEAIALGNAKSRAEKAKIMQEIDLLEANLKGQNIANAISELEMKIQKETGVDKASPAWMKVLARLFVGLTGK